MCPNRIRFRVSGGQPAAIDIPTTWAHKMINVGDAPATTFFWTNELFSADDPDTFRLHRRHAGDSAMTKLLTRPELIRLSRVIVLLSTTLDHVVVDTGQNWDPILRDVFFDELGLP